MSAMNVNNPVVWDDETFGAQDIINKTISVLHPEKNKEGILALEKLSETLCFTAPEIIMRRFWGDDTSICQSFTCICRHYFNDNSKVHAIFESAVLKFNTIAKRTKKMG
jgi:hypothetical protein